MIPSVVPVRALVRALVAACALLALAVPAHAVEPERDNFDARPLGEEQAPIAEERARETLRERLGRFSALSVDPRTDTLRSVGRLDGFLTGPSERDEAAIALAYVRDHADAFGLDGNDLDGLRLVDRSVVSGVAHLSWEQRYRGIPAADVGLTAAVTGAGRLIALTGPPAPDLAVRSVEPLVGVRAAYAAARRSVGAEPDSPSSSSADSGAERRTQFSDGGLASLTLYRSGAGYRLAWRVLVPVSSTGIYDMLVDARTGAAVRRANRVNFANAWVFERSPAALPQKTDQDLTPWLTSSTSLSGPNVHAFADVHDVVPFRPDSNTYNLTPEGGSDVAPDGAGNYEFPLTTVFDYLQDKCPAPTPGPEPPPPPTTACTWDPGDPFSWEQNREQSVTQLFYLVNQFADHLREDPDIQFVEGFEEHTGQPLGDPNELADPSASDPVLAQALDGADSGAGSETPEVADGLPDAEHRNNASFLTLPDGQPGLMQMHLWMPPDFRPDGTPIVTSYGGYDGVNDASVVFHEHSHGLSNRLVKDLQGFGALNTAQAGALGEGISDFYAMDFLEAKGLEDDDPAVPDVRVGRYLDNNAAGAFRYQPLDCEPTIVANPVAGCPELGTSDPDLSRRGGLTYADFGHVATGAEVHSDGEIWAQTLWSVRRALTDVYSDPLDPHNGIARARRYITGALRIVPSEPSFLDLRNAILQKSEDDDDLLWPVFAARGMGYFAATDDSSDIAPVADFTDPATLTGSGTISGTVVDEDEHLVQGATVGVAGHDTGLGPELSALSNADGSYSIDEVPATGNLRYPLVRARKAGFAEDREPEVPVTPGGTTPVHFQLERDWSSSSTPGGATITSFTGPDNTPDCGPGGLIDDDPGTVWGSRRTDAGQTIIVELRAPVDVARVAIDPGAGCGDDDTAALGGYQVLGASAPGGDFRSLGSNVFGPADLGAMRNAFIGNEPEVRYLKLYAKTPQDSGPGNDGAEFLDVAELHVAKVPSSPVGATADTGAAQSGASAARLNGTVIPHGSAAQVVFEYGTTTAYGGEVAAGDTPAGEATAPVEAVVTGLQPSTVYHFRVVAIRDGRRYEGGDMTFETYAAAVPLPSPAPAPPPPPAPVIEPIATATRLSASRLKASRKGVFKVRVTFGSAAPLGKARLTVLAKRTKLASALVSVRRSATGTVKLTLSKTGRRIVKRGRSRTVTLELRLPGGQTLKRNVKLSRAR